MRYAHVCREPKRYLRIEHACLIAVGMASIESHPDDMELLEHRSRILFEHGDPHAAASAIRAILDRDPKNASAHHNLGMVLYKLARFEEAAKSYRDSLEHRPNSPTTYLHLVYAPRESGDVAGARNAWLRVLALLPGDATATRELVR